MSMKMSQTRRNPVMDARDVTIAVITAIASGAALSTRTVLTTLRTLNARMKPRLMALPAMSTIDDITTKPSSLFHPTDQYPPRPYPRCLITNSAMKMPLKLYSMTTLASAKSSLSG